MEMVDQMRKLLRNIGRIIWLAMIRSLLMFAKYVTNLNVWAFLFTTVSSTFADNDVGMILFWKRKKKKNSIV